MRITTVARKPLSEPNVALNVLVHGTGGLNIDLSRLRTDDNLNGGAYSQDASARHDGVENWRYKRGEAGEYKKPTGRWPANTILQHLPGCQCLGLRDIKGVGSGTGGGFKTGKFSGQNGLGAYSTTTFKGFADADGKETIQDWSCVEGCPILATEEYSEGASRYFKQIQGNEMSEIASELLEYLYTMITPLQIEGETLIALDLDAVDWSSIEDNHYHGLIGRGTPTEAHTKEIWRVVKPGAHVLMIAPETSPLGYEGACALEDGGFEIRDAILLVQESGKSHYVAKASSKERNQGCETLALARNEARYALQASALEDEEISTVLIDAGLSAESVDVLLDGGDISKTEVPDGVSKYFKKLPSGSKYGNNHPTCKSLGIMLKLLEDIPKDALVMDPFLGSGTTGVACVQTGHSFIGMELSPDYIQIADARVRHQDRANAAWVVGVEIVSDAKPIEAVAPVDDDGVFDLFG